MPPAKQEVANSIELISIFFILMVSIIIITAVLYHNRKRVHRADLANFQNLLLQTHYEVQEQTLQTIGAELHDNIGQLLSLTSLILGSVEFDQPAKVQQKVGDAYELTLRSIKDMRMLGKLFQGDQLIQNGLIPAITYEIDWVRKSGKFEVLFDTEGEMPMVPNRDKDLIIFRIFQEAINNIIKHSCATRIYVRLNSSDSSLQLEINDNGIGFDQKPNTAERDGMGLSNIKRRAAAIGGKLLLNSRPNEGTQLQLTIPYS